MIRTLLCSSWLTVFETLGEFLKGVFEPNELLCDANIFGFYKIEGDG